MSAGLIYSIITMPFETAKNRMAFQVRFKRWREARRGARRTARAGGQRGA
jgi:hypothetical protein